MTYLMSVVAETHFVGTTLLASLKQLRREREAEGDVQHTSGETAKGTVGEVESAEAEEEELSSLLISWVLFGVLRTWEALLETWVCRLPLYWYFKSALLFAVGLPALRIHALLFEALVLGVDAVAHTAGQSHRGHVPLSALEVLLSAPVLALDLLFPSQPREDSLQIENEGFLVTDRGNEGTLASTAVVPSLSLLEIPRSTDALERSDEEKVSRLRNESSSRLLAIAHALPHSPRTPNNSQQQRPSSSQRGFLWGRLSASRGDQMSPFRGSTQGLDKDSGPTSSLVHSLRKVSLFSLFSVAYQLA
jgi:hypothetical protein